MAFATRQWADGNNFYGGVAVNMRFSGEAICSGDAVFEGEATKLTSADCNLDLRAVPKPGEESKFNNMDSLRDLLKQH